MKVNPNGKIPAIIDQDGPGGAPLGLFESGAILVYLTEKWVPIYGRTEVMQWLMFQIGGVGPQLGRKLRMFILPPVSK